MRVELYRVYEAVVYDDEGNNIRSEMIYRSTKKDAVERAQEMLTEEMFIKEHEEVES